MSGWVYAAFFDGQLLMMADGLVSGGSDGGFDTQFFGSFRDQTDFEASQVNAIRACPRVDMFAPRTALVGVPETVTRDGGSRP